MTTIAFNAGLRSATNCSSRPATISPWTAANSSKSWAAAWSCSPWPARPWPRNPARPPPRRPWRTGPRRHQCLAAHRRGWRRHRFHRQGRSGPEHPHLALPGRRGGIALPVASIKLRHGRHAIDPLRHRHLRQPDHAANGLTPAQNRRRRPRGPAGSGGRPFQSRPGFPPTGRRKNFQSGLNRLRHLRPIDQGPKAGQIGQRRGDRHAGRGLENCRNLRPESGWPRLCHRQTPVRLRHPVCPGCCMAASLRPSAFEAGHGVPRHLRRRANAGRHGRA